MIDITDPYTLIAFGFLYVIIRFAVSHGINDAIHGGNKKTNNDKNKKFY